MAFRAASRTAAAVHAHLKLNHLLEMPERELADSVKELESNPLFARLRDAGAVIVDPYPSARFAARRNAGRELASPAVGLGDIMDGHGDLAGLIQRVGQERFEDCFLGDGGLSDAKRAAECGITPEEARRLRAFVDRVYIESEFQGSAPPAAAPKVYSAVAGIELSDGRPVIAFFNRDIWKGRYRTDDSALERLKDSLPPEEYEPLRRFVKRLEFVEWRKTTLYRILEVVLDVQAEYLVSGDPGRRSPLTQSSLADRLDSTPSVIFRIVSNKSVRLPWGLEAPLKSLLPHPKSLLRDQLHDLALAHPDSSDEGLRREMARLFGATLSRRSIAQYRKELGLGGRGSRSTMTKRRKS